MGTTTFEKKLGRHHRKIILLVLAALLLMGIFVFLFLFRVTTINVTGNVHYTNEEIEDMVLTGPFAHNTLLASMFKKQVKVENVAFMDSISVEMTDWNTLRLDVSEKAVVGCVVYENAYYYFDKDGIVLEKTDIPDEETAAESTPAAEDDAADTDATGTDPSQDASMSATDGVGATGDSKVLAPQVVEDDESVAAVTPVEDETSETASVVPEEAVENYVPIVEGLVFESVAVGNALPVADSSVFNTINSLTKMINKNNIPPDVVTFDEENNLTLTYGTVRVALGADENLERKLQELSAILPQMDGLSGVLHLEHFDGTQNGVVFDKDIQ
ncbi:MAG: hypothetical protein PHS82_17100 [Lachnospiraceae bacterium]|nr:hypothetical protein [Lachnospiraceae bacterium]